MGHYGSFTVKIDHFLTTYLGKRNWEKPDEEEHGTAELTLTDGDASSQNFSFQNVIDEHRFVKDSVPTWLLNCGVKEGDMLKAFTGNQAKNGAESYKKWLKKLNEKGRTGKLTWMKF